MQLIRVFRWFLACLIVFSFFGHVARAEIVSDFSGSAPGWNLGLWVQNADTISCGAPACVASAAHPDNGSYLFYDFRVQARYFSSSFYNYQRFYFIKNNTDATSGYIYFYFDKSTIQASLNVGTQVFTLGEVARNDWARFRIYQINGSTWVSEATEGISNTTQFQMTISNTGTREFYSNTESAVDYFYALNSAPAGDTPLSCDGVSDVVCITWQNLRYNLGDTGTFDYDLPGGVDWYLYNYYISSGQSILVNHGVVSEGGTKSQTMTSPGVWTANIKRYGILSSPSPATDVVVATATTNVLADSPSWLLLNATQFTRVPFNVTYHIGYSLAGYQIQWFEIRVVDAANANIDTIYMVNLSNDGTVSAQVSRVYPIGAYKMILFDVKLDRILDSKSFTVVSSPGTIPTINISVSKVSMDRTSYFIGEYGTISYQVDDVNYTNYSIYGEIYNYDTSEVTKRMVNTFTAQMSSFETLINPRTGMLCERGTICYYSSGNNTIRLVAWNGSNASDTKILAFFNFTVATTTVDGWGLSISSNSITTTDTLTMTPTLPTGANGTLRIRDAGYNVSAFVQYSSPVYAGTRSYRTQIKRVNSAGVGYYDVELLDQFGNVKMHFPLTVTRVVVPPTDDDGESSLTFLSTNSFIIFIILISFLAVGGAAGGAPGLILAFLAAIPVLWLGGLIPLWLVFLDAGIVAMSLAVLGGGYIAGRRQ